MSTQYLSMADEPRIDPEPIEQPPNASNFSFPEELDIWDQCMDEPAIFDQDKFAPLVMPSKINR